MAEINGLDERISELKTLYQEAERLNLKNKTIELLVDINYLEELRELRSKQEPRKGKWKVVSDGYSYSDTAYICECSECKDTVWVYKDADRKWNFCPNCGADMREEEK